MKEFEFSLNIVERLIDIAKKKDISKLKVKYKEFEVYIDLKEPIGKKMKKKKREWRENWLWPQLLERFTASLLQIKKILLRLEIKLKKAMFYL